MSKSTLLKGISIRPKSTWRDQVYIENLRVPRIVVGLNNWNVVQPQDVQVNMQMATDFSKASQNDDLNYSLNYAVISRDVGETLSSKKFKNIVEMGSFLSNHLVTQYKGIETLNMSCGLPQGDIRCKNISINIVKDKISEKKTLILHNIEVLTLIGVFTFERLQKQYVTLDIEIPLSDETNEQNIEYREIIKDCWKYLENANFKTVESLVERTSQLIIQKHGLQSIFVKVIKLNAITNTDGVGVSCSREAIDFKGLSPVDTFSSQNDIDSIAKNDVTGNGSFNLPVNSVEREDYKNSTVYLAFGSNMNTKLENIIQGLHELELVQGNKILDISSMYESEPMYYEDQDLFYNGIIKLKTDLAPHELLKLCKKIEYDVLQRVKKFDNGPRTIDLDIILYLDKNNEHVVLNTDDLVIPHPRMLERGFVMTPLCEVTESDLKHPISTEPLKDHLSQLIKSPNGLGLTKILPLNNNVNIKFNLPFVPGNKHKFPIHPMYVVNITPDSFSDGDTSNLDTSAKVAEIKETIENALNIYPELGKIIIDIGGCSTRPNSKQVSAEEEYSRVFPILEMLNEHQDLRSKVIISLDTYRGSVARKLVPYIDIINDISGGSFEESLADKDFLWKVVKENPEIGYVLSHIRGDVSTMSKSNDYGAGALKEDITTIICKELEQTLKECLEFGVKRWQLILDPGLGFAKVGEQNLSVLKNIHKFRNHFSGYPILLGPSRKKFLGTITNENVAKNRDTETMAVVSKLAFDNSCDIIRIHALEECTKTLKVIDSFK